VGDADHAQILWWATRPTFNAPALLRRPVRLLVAATAPPPARRFDARYLQVIAMARKAVGADADSGARGDADIDAG
jgi:hypothetical protein